MPKEEKLQTCEKLAKNIFRCFHFNIGIMKISFQNISYKNYNLQKQGHQKASEFNVPKKATSSLDSFSNYNKAKVSFKGINQSFYSRQDDFIKRLKEERDKDGSLVYDYEFLRLNIIKSLSPKNIEWAEELCFAKDENGEYICKEKEVIPQLLSFTTKSNIDIAKQLYNSLLKRNTPLYLFKSIFEKTNKGNLHFVKRLYTTNEGEEFLSKVSDVSYLIQSTNVDNIVLVEKLCFDKDKDGNDLFPNKKDIQYLVPRLDDGDGVLAEKLCFLKDDEGKPFFNNRELSNALECLKYPETAEFIERLVFGKDENGNFLFTQRELLPKILENLTSSNTALAQKLCLGIDEKGNDVFPDKAIIPELLHFENYKKLALYKKLCFMKDEKGNNIIQDNGILLNISLDKNLKGTELDDRVLAKFFKEVNGFDKVEIIKKRNNLGIELIGTKVVGEEPNYVIKKVISNEKGQQLKTTTFYEDKKITSWVQNGKKSVYFDCQKVDYKNQHIRKVDSIIEIINDENNEPNHIIVTKPSAILSGLLETTKYQLSNYPQDIDLIELIKTNKLDSTIEELNLPKGEKISSTEIQEDGTVVFKQKYIHNGYTTDRIYSKKTDENGNTVSYKYKYEITDKKGKKILKNDRSWQQNDDNTTTTIINGKKYTTYFNNLHKSVKVQEGNGEIEPVFLINKTRDVFKQMFYDFIKTLPADLLFLLEKCTDIVVSLVDGEASSISSNNELFTQLLQPTVAHELGHLKQNISKESLYHNQELLKVYAEEMEVFRKENPPAPSSILKYFSPLSSAISTGLGEILAEVNAIMVGGDSIESDLQLRMEYLIRYFPQTVAKCADLLGFNAIED